MIKGQQMGTPMLDKQGREGSPTQRAKSLSPILRELGLLDLCADTLAENGIHCIADVHGKDVAGLISLGLKLPQARRILSLVDEHMALLSILREHHLLGYETLITKSGALSVADVCKLGTDTLTALGVDKASACRMVEACASHQQLQQQKVLDEQQKALDRQRREQEELGQAARELHDILGRLGLGGAHHQGSQAEAPPTAASCRAGDASTSA